MAKRYFNWKLAFVLVIGTVVLLATAVALRQWRKATRAGRGLELGIKAYEEYDWPEAAKQLGRFVAVNPDKPDVLLLYARAQLNIRPLEPDGFAHAVTALRSILRQEPGHGEAARELAEAYMMTGSASVAEQIAERCLAEGDANDINLERLSVCAMVRQRKFEEAKAKLEGLINTRPDQVWAYEFLAYLEGPAGEPMPYGRWTSGSSSYRGAVKWLDEAIEKNPDSAMAYVARAGFNLDHLGPEDSDAVLADMDRAEQVSPVDVEARLRLVWALIDARRFDRARRHLESLEGQVEAGASLWLPPKYAAYGRGGPTRIDADQAFWRQWARLALADGDAEEKADVAEQGLAALAAQPWDFVPIAVDLLIQAGRIDTAQVHLSDMRKKNINPPETTSLEGDLAEKQGRLREAVQSWQRAVSILQEQGRLTRSELRLKIAGAQVRLGDRQSAIGQLRVAISENPLALRPRYVLAQLLSEEGDWAAVLEEAGNLRGLTARVPEELALLEVQARVQLVMRDGTSGEAADLTKPALTRRLVRLENATSDGAETAAFARAREAIARDDLAGADEVLDEVERELWRAVDEDLVTLEAQAEDPNKVLLLRAQAALRQGNYAQTDRLLSRIGQARPDMPGVVLLRARLLDARGQRDQAIALLRETIEQHPESFELVRTLVVLLNKDEDYDACEAVLQEAFGRFEAPSVRRALGSLLAELYARTDRKDELHRWLASMAEEFPSDIHTRRLLLACDAVATDRETAQAVVEQIRQIEGEGGWQWRLEQAKLWLGAEGFEADYYEQAVRLLQENLLVNPEDGHSRRLLGDAHLKAGRPQQAMAAYREALDRAPDDIGLVLRLVSACRVAGETEQAMEVVRNATRRGLDSPWLRRLELDYHMLGGSWELASALSQQLVAEDPNDVSARRAQVYALARQKKFDEAARVLAEARAATPSDDSLLVTQVWLEALRDNGDEALRLCDETVATRQDVFSYLLRAWTRAGLEQYDKAAADYGRAIEKDSSNPRLWRLRGDFLRRRGRVEEAARDYRKALELAPDDPGIQQAAIDLFLAAQDAALAQEAETLIERALEADPNSPQIRFFKAWTLMSKGTVSAAEAARTILSELIDERPDMARAWELLGTLELRNGEPGQAVDYALRGLAHNPDSRGLTMLKAAAEAERDPRLAIPTLERWVAQHPGDADAVVRLAHWLTEAGEAARAVDLLRTQSQQADGVPATRASKLALARALYTRGDEGDRASARALFDDLIQETPDDARPLAALTELLSAEKAWAEVRQLLEGWFEEHPNNPQTVSSIANGLWPTEDLEGRRTAERLLRMVRERHPDHVATLLVLAVLLQQDGKSDEAIQLNRRVLDLDPDNAIAINNLAWLLCEIDGSRRALEEALKLAERGLQMEPEYADLIDTRGLIYYRLGKHAEAVEEFRRCVPRFRVGSTAAVSCHVNLARAYDGQGRKTQAREELRRAAAELREGLNRLDTDTRFEGYPDRRAFASRALKEALHLDDEIWLRYPDIPRM